MTNLIHFGASRTFNHPEDKHEKSIAQIWGDIRELATQGNYIASVLVKIDAAMKAKRAAQAEGVEGPEWARETLQFLDEYQPETENLDEALATLSAVL